jgi:hypothetical protein
MRLFAPAHGRVAGRQSPRGGLPAMMALLVGVRPARASDWRRFPARKRRANDLFLMRRVVPLGYFHGDKGCRAAEGRERTPLK